MLSFKFLMTKIRKVKNDLIYLPEAKKSLSQFLKKNHNDNIKRIYYLGITQNSNLGDWAQIYCINEWIKENYCDYEVLRFNSSDVLNYFISFTKKIKKIYKPDDIFIFESGYNINDMGCPHPKMHIKIIENFPNAKMIFMPATIYYEHEKNMINDALGYRKAKNMLFLARDAKTQEIAKMMMPDSHIILYPDIVTTLIGDYTQTTNERNGICICCRNDNEKYYSDSEFKKLARYFQDQDIRVDFTDTFIDCSYKEISSDITSKLYDKLNSFSKYKLIITDRFHGTVFSLIAGTPVIVLKTNNHKVIRTIEWFKDIYNDYVYYAKDINQAMELSTIIENKVLTHKLNPYFKEHYFKKLKSIADSVFKTSL